MYIILFLWAILALCGINNNNNNNNNVNNLILIITRWRVETNPRKGPRSLLDCPHCGEKVSKAIMMFSPRNGIQMG